MKYAAFLLLAACAVAQAQKPVQDGLIQFNTTGDPQPVQCDIITTEPPTLECNGKQVPVAVKAPSRGPKNCFTWPESNTGTIKETPCGASSPEDRSWHLMSVTYGGTVTLLKGLTHHEAEFMRDRLLGLPATAKEKAKAAADAAAEAKAEAVQDAADAVIIRAKAPSCSTGPAYIELPPGTCGYREAFACMLPKGKIDYRGESGQGCGISSGPLPPGDIKSAEVFQ